MLCAWALDRHFGLPAVEILPPFFRRGVLSVDRRESATTKGAVR
jgi:hypothetical protein